MNLPVCDLVKYVGLLLGIPVSIIIEPGSYQICIAQNLVKIDFRVGKPNLDEARAQYLREGIWISRDAQDKLTRANTRLAERQAVILTDFGKMTILGEFLAISSVIMCMLFIFVDMGNPIRIVNVFLYPTPNSLMFWDSVVLMGYLLLNVVISQVTFNSERKGIAPPKWIKPIIILSIPWAVSIHTVTAFLYSGLSARPFWLTAILAPRFLASAFAAGPAFLVILCLIMKKFANYDVGREPLKKLGVIITYAMSINVFFVLLELFTAIYSDIPEHMLHFEYLFFGLNGADFLVPYMWTSEVLAVISLVLLLVPKLRRNTALLGLASVTVIVSLWIDKGMGLVITGFIPSTLGKVVEYIPTLPELMITISIYAIGFLVLTVLYKVAIAVREEIGYK